MKLDVRNLRYMTKDDFRALAGVEAGMRNHELVPVELIATLAGLRHGGISKVLSTLSKFKLIAHDRSQYDGYKLTYSGYDYLALRSMLQRDTISGLGRQIGVGKESDVYLAVGAEGTDLVLKLQRLGRTSFRAIKTVRTFFTHSHHQDCAPASCTTHRNGTICNTANPHHGCTCHA
jgi:RIO kinase 2